MSGCLIYVAPTKHSVEFLVPCLTHKYLPIFGFKKCVEALLGFCDSLQKKGLSDQQLIA